MHSESNVRCVTHGREVLRHQSFAVRCWQSFIALTSLHLIRRKCKSIPSFTPPVNAHAMLVIHQYNTSIHLTVQVQKD